LRGLCPVVNGSTTAVFAPLCRMSALRLDEISEIHVVYGVNCIQEGCTFAL